MRNKKSNIVTDHLGEFVILIVAIIVIVAIYVKFSGSGSQAIDDRLGWTGDFDGDGISNFNDKCDCAIGGQENDGCPNNVDIEDSEELKELDQECKKEMEDLKKSS